MILDLSYYKLRVNNSKLCSVNNPYNKALALQHAMYKLGNVMPHIIWQMASAPDNGIPLLFSKIDLKDGYWRMVVNKCNSWNFAYPLQPEHTHDESKLTIPNALQMGWLESLLFFCTAIETARDLVDTYYHDKPRLKAHGSLLHNQGGNLTNKSHTSSHDGHQQNYQYILYHQVPPGQTVHRLPNEQSSQMGGQKL